MKKFLIISNINAACYKEIFPLIKQNKIWMGRPLSMFFIDTNKELKHIPSCWFTNLGKNLHAPINLYKHYNANEYPKYDNYDAINVDKVKNIPIDYYGYIGVPITFLDKYCPNQFEIIGVFNWFHKLDEEKGQICGTPIGITDKNGKTIIWNGPTINKKPIYKRILIKRKDK